MNEQPKNQHPAAAPIDTPTDREFALSAAICVHPKGVYGDEGGSMCCPITHTRDASFAPSPADERTAFEKVFPMPADCQRIGSGPTAGYAPTEYGAWEAHDFIRRWEGWKARAAASPAAHVAPFLLDSQQPAQADAPVRTEALRKGLFEARDAMRVMSNWVKEIDPAGYSWGIHMVHRANAVLNGGADTAQADAARAQGGDHE